MSCLDQHSSYLRDIKYCKFYSSVDRYIAVVVVVVVAMKKKNKNDPAKKLETRYAETLKQLSHETTAGYHKTYRMLHCSLFLWDVTKLDHSRFCSIWLSILAAGNWVTMKKSLRWTYNRKCNLCSRNYQTHSWQQHFQQNGLTACVHITGRECEHSCGSSSM